MLIFSGDIHSELRELVWKLTNQYKIENASVVVLGDFGVGFGSKNYMDQLYSKVSKKLEKNNITLYSIRGNHDDPEFFDGNHNYDRLIFLEDYKLIEIEGHSLYPIGGAVSTDRTWRKEYNDKMERCGSNKRVWWEGEKIKEIPLKSLPPRVEFIISHAAPISFEPVFIRNDWKIKDEDLDLDTWKSILKERNYLEEIKKTINFKYWFFGHYHKSVSGNFGDILYRGLDIMELYCINEDKK